MSLSLLPCSTQGRTLDPCPGFAFFAQGSLALGRLEAKKPTKKSRLLIEKHGIVHIAVPARWGAKWCTAVDNVGVRDEIAAIAGLRITIAVCNFSRSLAS